MAERSLFVTPAPDNRFHDTPTPVPAGNGEGSRRSSKRAVEAADREGMELQPKRQRVGDRGSRPVTTESLDHEVQGAEPGPAVTPARQRARGQTATSISTQTLWADLTGDDDDRIVWLQIKGKEIGIAQSKVFVRCRDELRKLVQRRVDRAVYPEIASTRWLKTLALMLGNEQTTQSKVLADWGSIKSRLKEAVKDHKEEYDRAEELKKKHCEYFEGDDDFVPYPQKLVNSKKQKYMAAQDDLTDAEYFILELKKR